MSTLFWCFIIFAGGFFIGSHYGYKRVMDDVRNVIDRVEQQAGLRK